MKARLPVILLTLLLFVLIPVTIADPGVQNNHASSQNTVRKIAFVSRRDGNSEIYTINDDGTNLTRLTNSNASKADNIMPQWSSDGTKLLYLSVKHGKHEIWIMSSDGSGRKKLADDCVVDYPPSWSPDSTKILFVAKYGSKNAIFTVNFDGSTLTRLTENDIDGTYPSWSPDGSRILYLQKYKEDNNIYLMNPDGTNQLRLTKEKGDYQAPVWSVNGGRIAYFYTKQSLFETKTELCAMNTDGSGLVSLSEANNKTPSNSEIGSNNCGFDDIHWSPDGTTIAFTKIAVRVPQSHASAETTFTYIYGTFLVSTDGNGHDIKLATTGDDRCYPWWNMDSSKVAYFFNKNLVIYNMKNRLDNTIKTEVSDLLGNLQWSPDGTKLVFAGKNGSFKKSGLYVATIDKQVVKLTEDADNPLWAPTNK